MNLRVEKLVHKGMEMLPITSLQNLDPLIEDSYFQRIEFTWSSWEENELEVNGNSYKHLWDYAAFANRISSDLPIFESDKVLFLGYGISDSQYDDYGKAFVEDKVLLIYDGEPVNKQGISKITGSTELSEWSTDPLKKMQLAYEKGVKLVIIIDNSLAKSLESNRRRMMRRSLDMQTPGQNPAPTCPHIYVSAEVAKDIIGKKVEKVIKTREKAQLKGKSKRFKINTILKTSLLRSEIKVESSNLLGMIEGTDPDLKDEFVIVTAHYDHLGMRADDIYNGADDNGSGTSTVLDIAEAFAMAKSFELGPRRSVIFMLVTGEEKGLLGSRFYVNNPVIPLEQTIVNVNVDMIGRVDEKHADQPNYVYVIGSNRMSTELHDINEQMNEQFTGLELDYTYNAKDDPNRFYYRSDHFNFARNGVPAIFYFSGVHEDYHKPGDTPDKIMYDKTAKIGRLIFHTAWELSNRDKRIEIDVQAQP